MQFNCRKVCDEGNILEGVMQHPLFLAIVAGEAAMQVCRWRSWGGGGLMYSAPSFFLAIVVV